MSELVPLDLEVTRFEDRLETHPDPWLADAVDDLRQAMSQLAERDAQLAAMREALEEVRCWRASAVGLEPTPTTDPETLGGRINAALAPDAGRVLLERLEKAETVLRGYEKWEAALLLTDASWGGPLPRFTQELWDSWMELQGKRNAALKGKP